MLSASLNKTFLSLSLSYYNIGTFYVKNRDEVTFIGVEYHKFINKLEQQLLFSIY